MTSLLILLGVALSSLIVYAEVEPQPGFDVNQLKGKWYDIGFASDHQWFVKEKPTMQMGFYKLTPHANGDLSMSYERSKPEGECERYDNLGRKGSAPGVFTYEKWGYSSTLTIHEVKEDEYAFVHVKLVHGNDVGILTKLIGRSQEVSNDVKEKWQKWTASLGISDENTSFLPKREGCSD